MFCALCIGLHGKHLFPSGVDGQATEIHPAESEADQDTARYECTEGHVDPGHVFQKRETRYVPRSDRRQSADASGKRRQGVVRQQVSIRGTVALTFPSCVTAGHLKGLSPSRRSAIAKYLTRVWRSGLRLGLSLDGRNL